MEEFIVGLILEAVPIRIAQPHLGPQLEFIIAVTIPIVLAVLGAWAKPGSS
ncbi:MAG: hypothetical protein KGR26_00745 [Cyanobacteria bacterium REEB65]|nr:hypothetical protein [Cyanobacteria bacterium REEB65]